MCKRASERGKHNEQERVRERESETERETDKEQGRGGGYFSVVGREGRGKWVWEGGQAGCEGSSGGCRHAQNVCLITKQACLRYLRVLSSDHVLSCVCS